MSVGARPPRTFAQVAIASPALPVYQFTDSRTVP